MKIPLYVESRNGHDTLEVQENELQAEVENQLKNEKWATIEKQDGSSELLTEQDIPKELAEKKEQEEWAEKFENINSVTATQQAKGG